MHSIRVMTVAFAVSIVAACAGGEAYVDRPHELNRDSPYFPDGPDLAEGDNVTVCYSKSASSPKEIFELADNECRRFGLRAELDEQVYTLCPMVTPIAAIFTCEIAVAGGGQVFGSTAPRFSATPSTAAPVQPKGSVLPDNFGSSSVSTTAKSDPFPTFLFNDPNRPAQ